MSQSWPGRSGDGESDCAEERGGRGGRTRRQDSPSPGAPSVSQGSLEQGGQWTGGRGTEPELEPDQQRTGPLGLDGDAGLKKNNEELMGLHVGTWFLQKNL